MVFDFVLTVLIVVHTPRVYPIEAKEKKPRGPEGAGGGSNVWGPNSNVLQFGPKSRISVKNSG